MVAHLCPSHDEGYGFTGELAGQVTVGAERAVDLRLCDVGRAEAIVDCLLLSDDPQFRPAGWTGNYPIVGGVIGGFWC